MGEIEPLNRKFYAWITLDDKKRRILHTASKKSCNPQRSSSGTTMWPNIPPELTSETYIIDYRLSGDVPTILHGAEGFAPSWLSFLSHKQFIFEWCDQEIKGTSQLPSINSLKDLGTFIRRSKFDRSRKTNRFCQSFFGSTFFILGNHQHTYFPFLLHHLS